MESTRSNRKIITLTSKLQDAAYLDYNNTKNSKDGSVILGKDNLWTWAHIKVATIKYAVTFRKNQNLKY